MTFQTLLLVPGQPAIVLEHRTKEEAETTLKNVKTHRPTHYGDTVAAFPLNYVSDWDAVNRVYMVMDVECFTDSERLLLIDKIEECVKEQTELLKGRKEHE